MAEPIGALRAEMSADAARFEADMGKARRAVRQSTSAMNRNFGGTAKAYDQVIGKMRSMIGVAALLAGAGALGLLIKKSIETADNIAKTADEIGISTDALQEYRFAADISGVSTAELDKALVSAVKRIGEAKDGTGTLTFYLNKNNSALLESIKNTKTTEGALDLLFRAMGQTTDASRKLALATNAFGRSGGRMALVAGDTAEKLANLRQQARDLGLVIDESLLRGAESAKDALTIAGYIIRTNVTKAILTLTPQIEGMAQSFARLAPAIAAAIDRLSPDEFKSVGALEKMFADLQKQLDDLRTSSEQGLLGGALSGPQMAQEVRRLEAEIDRIGKLLEKARGREAARGQIAAAAQTEAEAKGIEQLNQALRTQLDLLGKTEKERAILLNLNRVGLKMDDDRAKEIIYLTGLLYDMTEANRKAAAERRRTAEETKQFDDLNRKIQGQADRFRNVGDAARGAGEEIDRTAQASREFGWAMGSALEELIIHTEDYRSILLRLLEDIERVIIRAALIEPAIKGFSSLLPAIGTAIAGAFAPSPSFTQGSVAGSMPVMQHGGRITGPSLVGEKGPEIYVPDRPGMILPNETLRQIQADRSGDSINFNQTLNVSPGLQETVRREIIQLLPQIGAYSVQAVVDARERGGLVAKKMGARR